MRLSLASRFSTEIEKISTIFALSSGSGKAGVAVIRISGPQSLTALERLGVKTNQLSPRKLQLAKLICPNSGGPLDTGLAVWFPGPKSYTGEDVCELFIHGGKATISSVLRALSKVKSLRPAEPGEFTKRAFFNSKLDLTEIEGLSDLINAETESQRLVALRQLNGELSNLYASWRERLIKAVAHIEALIDFGEEEDIGPDTLEKVDNEVSMVVEEMKLQLENSKFSERISSGIHVAIVGKPNTGKSSILNVLCQRPAAIVTPIPGTTRDVLEVSLDLGGYAVQLFDTAGLRETADPIEMEGVRRAQEKHKTADILLVMMDSTCLVSPMISEDKIKAELDEIFSDGSWESSKSEDSVLPDILIALNKIDSVGSSIGEVHQLFDQKLIHWRDRDIPIVLTSCAPPRMGIESLLSLLVSSIDSKSKSCWDECQLFSRQRHQQLLRKSVESLVGYGKGRRADLVVSAEKIRSALYSLAKITGMTGEIRQMKSSMRHEVKAVIAKICNESKQRQSSSIGQKLLSHELLADSSRISVFLSNTNEPDTTPIVKWLLCNEKSVFIPRFKRGSTMMEMVKLKSLNDFQELPEVMWGIRQPPIDEIRESALDTGLDVVIMPGCAFTADGKRLGHGKGYYDRFLARYKEAFGEFPYLIGVGFKEQIVDDLPVTELDVIINEVITTD